MVCSEKAEGYLRLLRVMDSLASALEGSARESRQLPQNSVSATSEGRCSTEPQQDCQRSRHQLLLRRC